MDDLLSDRGKANGGHGGSACPSVNTHVAAFVRGVPYSQAGKSLIPLTSGTQNDKYETHLSVPCAIRWVNSSVQTALQIMLWMGWSNLSLILLEPTCFNRPLFHNLLIHRLFAFTSQWANTAINHYYILNFLAVSRMAEAIFLCLQSQHHLPSVLTPPLGTAKSPIPAQFTFAPLPCAPQGLGSTAVNWLLANPARRFRHLLFKCPKLFLKTGNREPTTEPRAAGRLP